MGFEYTLIPSLVKAMREALNWEDPEVPHPTQKMDNVNETLSEVARSSPIQRLRLASTFLGEASIDVIRLVAQVILSAVTAKCALWLRPWLANPAFKQPWCRILFEGHSVFSNKLDSAISWATGGKSVFLPQDRSLQNQKRAFPRKQNVDWAREARSYRPGQEFTKSWKSMQSSFKEPSKGVSSNTREPTKSF